MKRFCLETLAKKKEKEEEKEQIIPAGMMALGGFQALAIYHSQEQSSTALMGDNATEDIDSCI